MKIFIGGLALYLCFLSTSGRATSSHKSPDESIRFRKIVIFGDSYSDIGNDFKLTGGVWPAPSAYWKGRFSNGPNWVDQLDVSRISDYAYGGATTDSNFVQGRTKPFPTPVPGMRQQIQTYLTDNPVNKIDFDRTLYIFWGGGNDFVFNNALTPTTIVPSLFNGVQDLLSVGGKHFLVFNQLPVQYVPYTQPFNNSAAFTALTNGANYLIAAALKQKQTANPQASLNMFDINAVITKVITTPSTYFTNTATPCWSSPANSLVVTKLCPDPNKYVFVDDFHFSSPVHTLIANAARPFFLDSYQINSAGCYVRPASTL